MLSNDQKLETYRVLGLTAMFSGGSEYKIAWAMYLLESGIETENLAVLATLLKPVNEFEAEDYFNRVLSELRITRPTSLTAIEGYAKVLTKEIIEGILTPEKGVAKIYEAIIHLDYPGSLGEFTALEDEWYCECINGWSLEQRAEEIVKASKDAYGILRYPSLSEA
ncbi:hypothetical protein [Microbulbifer sp. PAAF003]|uniref:hypothetical protein n=1 Tax=unclassified Microbulbifer TaxID=2619833 RepID=UPI0040392A62